MFAWKRTGRAAVIEHLELRQLLSTGYLTTTVANFNTAGLKNPTQTVVRDSAGDIFGIAQGGMNLGQGVAMILAGAAAEHYPPSAVIAVAGLLGVIAAISVAMFRRIEAHQG